MVLLKLLVFGLILQLVSTNPCVQINTESGSYCVCNSTYCDDVPEIITKSKSGEYQWYSTSKATLGFQSTTGTFSTPSNVNITDIIILTLALENRHQTIFGFGGAFTDATGLNVLKLSQGAQTNWFQSYFGDNGIQYSVGRVPIGGTDFSTRGYTYLDELDESLETFALEPEDHLYKIPFVKRAVQLRGETNFNLFASAWSAPIWMKTGETLNGFGKIRDEYFDLWAQYYIKFFEEYQKEGVNFWGVTTQNEPIDGLIGTVVSSNGFNSSTMVRWINDHLGPTIRNSTFNELKIIGHDDQRLFLPIFSSSVLPHVILDYLDGIGLHWYSDFVIPASFLELAKVDGLFALSTEACIDGTTNLGVVVDLGSWHRAERYIKNIIEHLQYDFVGWIDWNMALDEDGGPNWVDNQVDSPVIINATSDEFYKQPMFYGLGHFSKFITNGSVRIDSIKTGSKSDDIHNVEFVNDEGLINTVIWNSADEERTIQLVVLDQWEVFTLEPHSINTFLYKN